MRVWAGYERRRRRRLQPCLTIAIGFLWLVAAFGLGAIAARWWCGI